MRDTPKEKEYSDFIIKNLHLAYVEKEKLDSSLNDNNI